MNIKTGDDLFEVINTSQVETFTSFYKQFFKQLILASDKYVKDIHVAEEIVQDVFLKVWETPDSLIEIKSLKAYFYRSVINSSINYLNRQKNINIHHQKIASDYTDEYFFEMDEDNALIVFLHQEINKLPNQCQKIFKLNRFDHLKYKEIAVMLNISEKTVENHLANALKILRESFSAKKTMLKSLNTYNFLLSFYLF